MKKWNNAPKFGPKKAENKNELRILSEFSSEFVAVIRVVLVQFLIYILPSKGEDKVDKKNIQFSSGIVGSRNKNVDNNNGTRKRWPPVTSYQSPVKQFNNNNFDIQM